MDEGAGYRIDPSRQGVAPEDEDAIWQLLVDADQQFIPPLSARSSSVQTDLGASDADPEGPREYFSSLRAQHFLIARGPEGRAVGFMSFRKDYRLPDEVPVERGTYCYVSTVFVERAARRQGITRAMYERLLDEAAADRSGVATRTWSTNTGHLALLEQLGIRGVHTIPDGRGPGIDTLYLARPWHREEADDES